MRAYYLFRGCDPLDPSACGFLLAAALFTPMHSGGSFSPPNRTSTHTRRDRLELGAFGAVSLGIKLRFIGALLLCYFYPDRSGAFFGHPDRWGRWV